VRLRFIKNISKSLSKRTEIQEAPVLWGATAPKIKEQHEEFITLYNIPVSPQAIPGQGKIWVVQSPEGGDGSTTVATNLAAFLAKKHPEKVILLDLDGFGAVRSRMGLPVSHCLVNILDWQDIRQVSQIQKAMVHHSSGVMVVPGVLHHDHMQFITADFIFNLLSLLKERFDHVILDCPPVGQQNNTWAAYLAADTILAVIKPDRTSLDLIKDNLSYLNRLGCSKRTYTLLNQAGMPGGIRKSDILNKKQSDINIDFILPYSEYVHEANNKRELVVLTRARDDFSQALKEIAEKLERQTNPIVDGLDKELLQKLAANCSAFQPPELEDEEHALENASSITAKIPGLKEHDYRRIKIYVQDALRRQLKPEENKGTRDPIVRSRLRSIVSRALVNHSIPLGQSAAEMLVEELGNECLGFGPLEPFFYDPEVTEIKARWNQIRVEKHGQEFIADATFRDEQHIRDVLDRMLAPTGRAVSPANPKVIARLFDGSRLIAHIPPVAVHGTLITIRRFRQDLNIENLIENGAMSREMAEFLRAAVITKQNLVVSGGTSSGKTTLLNCIASFIPHNESIVTIEDPAELQLQHPDVRSLEARPANNEGLGEVTMRELVADALRMAPKRIIVGECRKGETFDMLQAMNTGHEGSMNTMHANTAYLAGKRMVSMVQMADMGLPYDAIVELCSVVDIIVQAVKERKTGKRRIDHIAEVVGVKRNEEGVLSLELNYLWQYNKATGQFEWVADKFTRQEIFIDEGNWTPGWLKC